MYVIAIKSYFRNHKCMNGNMGIIDAVTLGYFIIILYKELDEKSSLKSSNRLVHLF